MSAVLALCLSLLAAGSARAEPEAARIGIGAELPLLTVYGYHATPKPNDGADGDIEQSGLHVGPFLSEDDVGAQVPLLVSVGIPLFSGFLVGARLGAGSMCLDGPSYGEQGQSFSWEVQPFARYIFLTLVGLQLYGQGGPLLGHSCTGNTVDQNDAELFGFHLGAGTELDLNDWLSLYGELRLLSAWGEHEFKSHGEVSVRRSGSDLRGRLVLGVAFWF